MWGIIMRPEVARADRTDTQLTSGEVYYFYEDQIGRPIVMSSYNGLYGSYFKKYYGSELPYFVGVYKPFGQINDSWILNSGITIGDPDTTGQVHSTCTYAAQSRNGFARFVARFARGFFNILEQLVL